MTVKIILSASDRSLFEALNCYFAPILSSKPAFLELTKKSIFDIQADAYVSPANSFGFMDGGIDALYMQQFPGIEKTVQTTITKKWGGELPVGTALLAPTGVDMPPWLIVAPTMRVPMRLSPDSVNAHLAARAVFQLIQGPGDLAGPLRIRTVAMPGLGTGCGGMNPYISAKQVHQAYLDIIDKQYQPPKTWTEAFRRHMDLLPDATTRGQGND